MTIFDTDPAAAVALALTPVLCIDCDQYVPFGWVDNTAAPKCPEGFGASGSQHGHRIPNAVVSHVKDLVANQYAQQPEPHVLTPPKTSPGGVWTYDYTSVTPDAACRWSGHKHRWSDPLAEETACLVCGLVRRMTA